MSGWDYNTNIYPEKECTWWVWGCVYEYQNMSLPGWGNAENWYYRAKAAGYSTSGDIYSAKPGDILCWDHRYNPDTVGHVQYVVSDNGSTLTVSESYAGLSSPPAYVTISKSNPTYGRGDGFPFLGIISLNGGGGGGGDPDNPPEPKPGGHWEWVEDGGVVLEYIVIDFTDIYECGKGTFKDQSGNQDTPQAPIQLDGNPDGSRLDERWEPFNMYTYERNLTYLQDKSPIWSEWELKYQGSDNFPLGVQPEYGNGWEVKWEDE